MTAAQLLESRGKSLIQNHRLHPTAIILLKRPWMIARQLNKLRRTSQGLAPIIRLFL